MPSTTNPVIEVADKVFSDRSRSAAETKMMLQDAIEHIEMQVETLPDEDDG